MDDGTDQSVTFTHDAEGLFVERAVYGAHADQLDVLLREFGSFLKQIGFTYVDELRASCGDCYHSSGKLD